MILFLDTSCMVKLYFDEPGSDEVEMAVGLANEVACSMVTEAEVRSALARRRREGLLSASALTALKQDFLRNWPHHVRIQVSEGISAHAGDLAETHGLRGFDAIQLACALSVVDDVDGETWFYSADSKLNAAAKREGLKKTFPADLA
jgi:predicted nucleic acid-binding protein